MVQMMNWAIREVRRYRQPRHPITMLNGWDPVAQTLRQYSVLQDAQDADSGEEYFRETEVGLARYVRPQAYIRRRLNVEEMDCLEFSMLEEFPEGEGEEEEPQARDAEVQVELGPSPNLILLCGSATS